jgi:Pyruvate/2-oxoacid:ferredoxin oxidoreductase gamma subunit
MELEFVMRKRSRKGQVDYVICLNDKVLRAYAERPSKEEVKDMHRAVCNVLEEYTERMESWLGEAPYLPFPAELDS